MAALLAALASGLLFGLGLTLSQMVNPAKVLSFLDVLGRWDPTLAFVLAGAVGVTLVAFPLTLRRGAPLLAARFALPTRADIDRRLLAGAAIFGIGWGLVGLCPGPAFAALLIDGTGIAVFFVAMIAGMLAERLLTTRRASGALEQQTG